MLDDKGDANPPQVPIFFPITGGLMSICYNEPSPQMHVCRARLPVPTRLPLYSEISS